MKYISIQKELNIKQQWWLELVIDYNLENLHHPDKIKLVPDVLSRKIMTMYLMQQKEILKE